MRCYKTGAEIHFGNGHCYASDIFECPKCKTKTAVCNRTPHQVNDIDFLRGKKLIVDMNE
jgi:hypothetical protein